MKRLMFIMVCLMAFMCTSCLTAGLASLFREPDYTVYVDETPSEIHARIASYEKKGEYIRKFRTIDKGEKYHDVVIYDRQYFSIDGVLFAYNIKDAMWYGLAITLPGGGWHKVSGTDKIIGYSGFATCVDNSDTTVSFILSQKLFSQSGYGNRSEAVSNIKGVSFYGLNYNQGYVDDFGRYQRYDYWDFFDEVFQTTKKDVKKLMYSAISVRV